MLALYIKFDFFSLVNRRINPLVKPFLKAAATEEASQQETDRNENFEVSKL